MLRFGIFGIWLAVAALAAPLPSAAETPVASGVRIGQHGVETRVVVDFSAKVDFAVFSLADPYRVVVDLSPVDWQIESDSVGAGGGVIEAIRFGHLRPETSRIVLDLSGPFRIMDTFALPPSNGFPHRVVLDLMPVDGTEFGKVNGTETDVAVPAAEQVPIPRMKPSRTKPRVIVIDAGHGGQDPGAVGKSGTREKNVVLAAAREIKDRLEATGRYQVVLTRNSDSYVKLRDRVALARRADGDLFISLHADAHPSSLTQGVSVYTLSETASDAEAAALAEKENKSDIIAGFDLSDANADVTNILIDLAQRETMNRSAIFANVLIGELAVRVRLLRRSHRFAGFAVLKAPDIPSVLVELGYISNREEERLLRSKGHRDGIADAIVGAIDTYFAEQYKLARS